MALIDCLLEVFTLCFLQFEGLLALSCLIALGFLCLPLLGSLVMKLCLGDEVAAGGLSKLILSESEHVEKAVKLAKLFDTLTEKSENRELLKLGKPHWQQIQDMLLD